MLLFTRNYREGNDPTQDHGPWTSGLMSREKSTDRGLFRAPRNTVDPNRGEEKKEVAGKGPFWFLLILIFLEGIIVATVALVGSIMG